MHKRSITQWKSLTQTTRALPAKSYLTEKRRSVLRTLWPPADQVPQGTSEGLIHQSIDLRRADTAPKRDRSAGARDDGAADEADGTGAGDHRATEGRRTDGVGRCHEQHPQRSGGGGTENHF